MLCLNLPPSLSLSLARSFSLPRVVSLSLSLVSPPSCSLVLFYSCSLALPNPFSHFLSLSQSSFTSLSPFFALPVRHLLFPCFPCSTSLSLPVSHSLYRSVAFTHSFYPLSLSLSLTHTIISHRSISLFTPALTPHIAHPSPSSVTTYVAMLYRSHEQGFPINTHIK